MSQLKDAIARLQPLIGKYRYHSKVGVYANGERKEVDNIPDSYLINEVEYDIMYRIGRALFIDSTFIYEGDLTIERCMEIEKELKNKQKKD